MQYLEFEEIRKLKDKLTEQEYLELLYYNYPSVWMEHHLPNPQEPDKDLELRFYQTNIINDHSKKKIIRMGRQMGKSASIQMLILYYGLKRPGSKIIVVGPQKTHVEQIFEECVEFVSHKPELAAKISTKRAPLQMTFDCNGRKNRALFMTTGEESGGKGLSIRGKTANVLFIDEADYINDHVMDSVVIPTTNSFKEPQIFLSSTPTGRRGYYRNTWDGGFYKTFHYRSNESPAWTDEKEAEIRASCTKLAYIHEYEAEWGDTEAGLFSKGDMAVCANLSKFPFPSDQNPEGIIRQYSYGDNKDQLDAFIKPKFRILGVDWNKSQNGTRLVWVDFDENHNMWLRGKWKIDDAEFTQNVAMDKIIKLHENINFDYIMVDIGYGSTQLEDLHLYGLKYKETNLHKIVKAVPTDSQMEITDIATGEDRKTYVKNFFVEAAVRYMEQNRVRVPSEENLAVEKKSKGDASLFDEMNEFVIDKYTANGRPVYRGKAGDHDLDAFMFTLYGYLTEIVKTQNLWHKLPKARAKVLGYDKILEKRNRVKDKIDSLYDDIQGEEEVNLGMTIPNNKVYVDNGFNRRTIKRVVHNNTFGRRSPFKGKSGISRRIR